MSQSDQHSAFLGHLVIQIQKALPKSRVFRMTSGVAREPHFRRLGIPGHPDLFVLPGHGAIIYVEAKTGTGRLSAKQSAWAKMCDALNTPFVLAHLPTGADPRHTAIQVAAYVATLAPPWSAHVHQRPPPDHPETEGEDKGCAAGEEAQGDGDTKTRQGRRTRRAGGPPLREGG